MPVTVRQANAGEEARVLAFYHNLIAAMKESPYRPTWTAGVYPLLEDLQAAASRGELYLAEETGCVIGAFVLTHMQAAEYESVTWSVSADPGQVSVIHLLAVSPALHGRGIAKALLQKAQEVCRERGDKAIRLDTLTWNVPGNRLYSGFGFRYLGDHELYYPSAGTIPFSMYELEITNRPPSDQV